MKCFKRNIIIFLVLPLMIIPFLFLSGCKSSIYKLVSESVSEFRHNYFFGSDKNFAVSFTDGEREEDFKMDGIKTKMVPYGVIVLYGDFEKPPKFELKIKNKTYVGEMERNPFDGTFVFDIEHKILDEEVKEIEIYIVDADTRIKLNKLSSDWEISENKALTIFIDKNKTLLGKFTNGKTFDGEIFIKLVADKKTSENIYWYVLCVTKNGNVFGNVIDVNSGEIVQNF